MKKVTKKKAIALTLAAGIVTLSTAAFAGVMTSNGYGVYKEAIKKLMYERNYTTVINASYSVDGEEYQGTSYEQKLNLDGDVKLNSRATNKSNPEFESVEYYQDGMYIYDHYTAGEKSGYYVNDSKETAKLGAQGIFNLTNSGSNEHDKQIVDKYINFAEKCADLLVGDLKNNFILAGQSENTYSYGIELSGMQIPEIINAGLSLVCAESNRFIDMTDAEFESYAKENPMILLQDDVNVKNASCQLTVDHEGRLTDNTLSFTLEGKDRFGNMHELTFSANGTFSDYGTTQPERLDLNNVQGKVVYASTELQERINEIDKILENENLDETEREDYENERESLSEAVDRTNNAKVTSATTVIGSADGPTEVQISY